jgi:hypothetical protein
MPPEQLGGSVDETSDLYALGATLVHLASGVPPEQMFRRGLELHFGPHVSLSPRTAAFLRRLVAPRPEDRFRSAREALEALSREAPAQHAAAPRRERSPRARLLTLGVGMGLLVIGGLALQARTPRTASAPRTATAPLPPMPQGVLSDIQQGAPEVPQVPAEALALLRACPVAKALLGGDLTLLECADGECQVLHRDGDRNKASWSLPARGARSQGTYLLFGRREADGWRVTEARLHVEGKPSVDVHPCQPR